MRMQHKTMESIIKIGLGINMTMYDEEAQTNMKLSSGISLKFLNNLCTDDKLKLLSVRAPYEICKDKKSRIDYDAAFHQIKPPWP
jgi:hypothetical protein